MQWVIYTTFGILPGIGVLAGLGIVAGGTVWVLKTKHEIDDDPGYLYLLLYTNPNTLKKQLLLSLLHKLYGRSKDLADRDTAIIVQRYLSVTEQAKLGGYSFEKWISALQDREDLVGSDLGSNLVKLCLILQEASKRKTLRQIARFGLNVEEMVDGNISVQAQGYQQAQFMGPIVDSIDLELIALGKISRIICEYIARVDENTALDQLEGVIGLIQDIDLKRVSTSFETIVIQQTLAKWRDIGQAEMARIPYIAGRPIIETKLFFGRELELTQIKQSLKNNHIAVWGKRRIGKTSILHQLKGHLLLQPESQYRFIPVFLNVEPLMNAKLGRLLHLLVETTERSLIDQFSFQPLPLICERKDWHEYIFSDSEQDLNQIITQLQQELAGFQIRLVWLIDEVDKLLEQNPEVQIQLKALACSQLLKPYLVLVLAGLKHPHDFTKNEIDEFYSFFDDVNLSTLLPSEARNLVVEPVQGYFSYNEDAIEVIIQECEYEPYLIQSLCREALGIAIDQKRTVVTLKDVETGIRYLPKRSPDLGGQV